ncbi:LOW QUALITY PROTEIN: hypothetical protein KUTeg_007115, partial [Tegillarca granosa]
ICPPSLCSAADTDGSRSQRPHGTGGSVFYNGDIVLDSESEKFVWGIRNTSSPYHSRRTKRATMRIKNRLWPKGIVYYTFSDDINPLAKRGIRKAMKHITENTCIKFKKKKNKHPDHIRFISEPGCWSLIGRVGGEQKLSLGRGCEQTGTAIHEILHALGVWHEQSRPDRDNFVKVILDNVSPRFVKDFEKLNSNFTTNRGYPYDYSSIMHYSERSFTYTGGKTIRVIGVGKELGLEIGQREELSNLDIAQIRDMYNCNEKEDTEQTVCPDGWVKSKRSCYKFVKNPKYQYAAAQKFCNGMRSNLVHINSKYEDTFLKKYLWKKFKNTLVWRTGGRLIKDKFAWDTGKTNKSFDMKFNNWAEGFPSSYSSLALTRNQSEKSFQWRGVWIGSLKQLPKHAYSFICERTSKRKMSAYKDGRDYRGQLDHTVDGITCQKWTSFYPQKHKLLPAGYTGKKHRDGLGEHNYCRNPAGQRRKRPWCFVTKSLKLKKQTWQYCDVRACTKKRSPNDIPESNSQSTEKQTTKRDT